jgi:hypothetical protein
VEVVVGVTKAVSSVARPDTSPENAQKVVEVEAVETRAASSVERRDIFPGNVLKVVVEEAVVGEIKTASSAVKRDISHGNVLMLIKAVMGRVLLWVRFISQLDYFSFKREKNIGHNFV